VTRYCTKKKEDTTHGSKLVILSFCGPCGAAKRTLQNNAESFLACLHDFGGMKIVTGPVRIGHVGS